MLKNRLFTLGLMIAGIITIVSCSSDDDKYNSMSPRFTEITLKDLSTGESTLRAGEPFVATAIQGSKGKLLNSTRYKWEVSNTEEATHKYIRGVVYDQESGNPTDTIVIPTAGRYELIFSAEYNISGIANGTNFTESLNNGGSATYQASSLKFKVTLTKSILVR